jgi:hypothetical protein
MTTTWKSNEREPKSKFGDTKSNTQPNHGTRSAEILSSWSRQQKIAMIAGFAILGLLLALSACSSESAKPALIGVPNSPATTQTPVANQAPLNDSQVLSAAVADVPAKKTPRKRPANVTFNDTNYGVSFLYPRKYSLSSGDKLSTDLTSGDKTSVEKESTNPATTASMNFVQPGGVSIATVALPPRSYPGTDFASAFFNVNVNHNVSEQECSHFAFVDTRNADSEAIDAEKVQVGSSDMTMTSDFSASAVKQSETQYYHAYENGVCYEYVLGLGTQGYGSNNDIEHVNRDEVFGKLEKILATVKVSPVEEPVAEQSKGNIASGKE